VTDPLVQYLLEAARGRTEWRVQDPVTRAYCIAFDGWHGGERAARQWLADEIRKYPKSQFAGYEVAEIVVFDDRDKLMQQAARRIEALLDHRSILRDSAKDVIAVAEESDIPEPYCIARLRHAIAATETVGPSEIGSLTPHPSLSASSSAVVRENAKAREGGK
jgi:hypothetical protein